MDTQVKDHLWENDVRIIIDKWIGEWMDGWMKAEQMHDCIDGWLNG